ncbi:arginyl-tRNA synthetase [Candidatus Aquiluna sp. IMCC13023]|uniref:arginine--tRNA ligase n=1 Tax=Candidatus Aquiluna sp. IMCC13023 TaxID=1081644 RepID=UPI00025B3418|nr:arginine--tRNA ligase [Candidatus Aquiluna sp. IMCC13023]EIC92170.1 arginyl-tRNA synthetase [Candidatus Aquiluna sp. IMCC13023]
MTPEQLSSAILNALSQLMAEGGLAKADLPAAVVVERPKNRDHGDWATNVAMQLGKSFGMTPRQFAEILALKLETVEGISKVEIAGPGFINLFVSTGASASLVKTIVDQGADFGRGDSLVGVKLNLEFVSANPTGPIHLGGTRWAAVGDSLARIFDFCGAEVTREYYFNDHGGQIDRFARSLVAAAKNEPAPEDGYSGQYIFDIAKTVMDQAGKDLLSLESDETQEAFRSIGVEFMFAQIRQSLHDFGVDFDVFFHENSLYESGAVERSILRLGEKGHTFVDEGATWLRSSTFGDDRDRVIVKSDGSNAYIAGDIAYYLDKRERGFDQCIYMLGADHHGYVQRMMAICAAFGDTPGKHMEILIGQMVNLVRAGQPVKMSKRAGTVITMEDLVEAVGVDAARYSLARSSINSSLDVDLEILTKKTNDNPVFYVQYAHARTRQVSKNASTQLVERSEFVPEALSHLSEQNLIAQLAQFPQVVETASEFREPHRVARYLEELAGTYHRFYDHCRVIPLSGDPVETVHRSRLWLNDACTQVLANGLGLLGVSAPERM